MITSMLNKCAPQLGLRAMLFLEPIIRARCLPRNVAVLDVTPDQVALALARVAVAAAARGLADDTVAGRNSHARVARADRRLDAVADDPVVVRGARLAAVGAVWRHDHAFARGIEHGKLRAFVAQRI